MRASYRYALAALLATALAVAVGVWLGTRPPPEPLGPPPRPEPGDAAAPPLGDADRSQMLDRVEADETERFGAEEAARRRRQRERMLDARLNGHDP